MVRGDACDALEFSLMTDFHDRFLIIDNVELHGLGSSINCLGRRVTSYTTVWLVSGGAKEMGMKGYMRESGISTSRSDRAMCVFSQ